MTAVRNTFEIRGPRLNWVEPHTRNKWPERAPDVDTVHDLDLADLWDLIQRITARHWTGTPYCEDMMGIASESFVHSVNSFDEWCHSAGHKPNRQLFTHYAKKGARFATLKHWTNVIEPEARDIHVDAYDTDDDAPAEAVFTQLRVRDRDRTLLHAIAPKIRTMLNRNERIALALLAWEELSVKAASELMGYPQSQFSKISSDAANKILLVALNEATVKRTPVAATRKSRAPLSIDLIRYIDDQYRTSPDGWLDSVEIGYVTDVSYLVEILDRAHGKGPRRGNLGGWKPTITDEQHQEIIQRRSDGESQQRVADEMGLTRMIVRRAEQREQRKRQQG